MNYLLYGEQYPMIKRKLKKIIADRVVEADAFNVVKLDMDNVEYSEIIDEASMLPLGYDNKVVIIDNTDFLSGGGDKNELTRLEEVVKNSQDDIDLIFIVRSSKIDDKNPIVKLISEHGVVNQFMNITKEQWPQYVRQYFQKKEVKIDNDAVYELVARVDGDLNRFINEADKLCLYKNNISLLDVTLMVSKPIEDDVFQLSNALLRGDNASAISIYRDLQLLGSRATDTLIPMLGSQFRFMSEVFFLNERGLSKSEIASQLSTSEGRVGVTLKYSRYLSRRAIAQALNNLYELDYKIKSGQIDRFYGFELFLIDFPN